MEIEVSQPGGSAPIQILKDGAAVTVSKDTSTPGNTIPLPVEIVSASGQEVTINIANGDIEMQSSHTGANYDSMRVGDGTTLLAIEAGTGAALTKVTSSALPTGAATSAKQDTGNTSLASIDTKMDAQATAVLQTTGNTSLGSIDTKLTSQATLLGAVTETAPATDTASSGLNGRLQRIAQRITSFIAQIPATLGYKDNTASMATVLASATASGSGSALNANPIASTDVSGYSEIYVHFTGTSTCAVAFEFSNDGSAWVAALSTGIASTSAPASSQSNPTAQIFKVSVAGKFFRVRVSSYTSGTINATALFMSASSALAHTTARMVASDGSNILQGFGSAAFGLRVAAVLGNATAGADFGSGALSTNTLRAVLATDQPNLNVNNVVPTAVTVKQAAVTVGTTAVRCTTDGSAVSSTRRYLCVQPTSDTTTARFFIGSSSVTSSGATRGVELFPGATFERADDAGEYYIISDTAAQTVFIVEQE